MSAKETSEFNALQFEKKLTSLKDSQDSINSCCQWCLSNRQHHKKIVNSWLNVLKRVKVEHRLILFYLANDVIQYSKRKKYEYVESWGTALQKATTLVRDDRVKQKIQRIFKIWEDRGVYSEEFISDLCGLISVTPTAPKNDEPHEFQTTFVINKIRACSNLEADTDLKLKQLKELNPKILETESYLSSLKDRAHLDDTEKELEVYAKCMEDYVNALKAEVKNRINLISVLKQADVQLDTDRKDVKTVANAYKAFGSRVKTFQKKLEEHKANMVSPIPSPDVNAPSPTSDSDIDLPEGSGSQDSSASKHKELDFSNVQITNANYYNPVPAPSTDSSSPFAANGFTSFMGSNLPFNVQNFTTMDSFNTNTTSSMTTAMTASVDFPSLLPGLQPPPPPKTDVYPSYGDATHSAPLLPPPMPPFGSKDDANFAYAASYDNKTDYGSDSFNISYTEPNYEASYGSTSAADTSYDPLATLFGSDATSATPEHGGGAYVSEAETLYATGGGCRRDVHETPESPPAFEKEAYREPIEYHDGAAAGRGGGDVDHRVLMSDLGVSRKDKVAGRCQDVDHRNLISLIGSPGDSGSNQLSNSNDAWTGGDQDYRTGPFGLAGGGGGDRDYRFPFDIEQQLKLPPPPPPPTHSTASVLCQIPIVGTINHQRVQDNVESIDMDLSDEDNARGDNLRVVINSGMKRSVSPKDHDSRSSSQNGYQEDSSMPMMMLEPPPPFPEDLADDAEEHAFLDQMSKEIDQFLNPEDLDKPFWDNNSQQRNLQPPPAFPNLSAPPPPPLIPLNNANWMGSDFAYNNGPPPLFKNSHKRGKFGQNRGRGGGGGHFNNNNGSHRSGGYRGRGGRFKNNYRGNFRGNRGGFS